MSIKEFNELTPYQLGLILTHNAEQANQKIKDRLFEIYIQSIWTSRWVFAKKIPSFDSIISKMENKKPQSDEQMLENIKMLNALFGGEVRVIGEE